MGHNHKRLLDDFHKSYLSKFGLQVEENPYVHRPISINRGQFYYESSIALRNIHNTIGFEYFGIVDRDLTLDASFNYIPAMARYFVILQKVMAYTVISNKVQSILIERNKINIEKYLQSCFVIDVPHALPLRPGKVAKFRQEMKIKSFDENFNIRSKAIFGTFCPDRVLDSYDIHDLRDIRGRFYNYHSDFEDTVFTDLNRDLSNKIKETITPDGLFTDFENFVLEALAIGNTSKEIANDEAFRVKFNRSRHLVNKACSSILEKCKYNILPNFPGVILNSAKDCAIFLEKISCL